MCLKYCLFSSILDEAVNELDKKRIVVISSRGSWVHLAETLIVRLFWAQQDKKLILLVKGRKILFHRFITELKIRLLSFSIHSRLFT